MRLVRNQIDPPDIVDVIRMLQLIRMGVVPGTAAAMAGITEDVYYDMLDDPEFHDYLHDTYAFGLQWLESIKNYCAREYN